MNTEIYYPITFTRHGVFGYGWTYTEAQRTWYAALILGNKLRRVFMILTPDGGSE